MLPWKIFENLHTAVVILVLFEQFLGKFCLNFLPLKCFTGYDAFCSYIGYVCLGRKAYCYQKGSNLWKNCINQKTLENGWWGGMHAPSGFFHARTH